MPIVIDLISSLMLIAGLFFFVSGIIALWRFPDTLSRLHAITKADNLGLGFIIVAVALQVGWSVLLLKLAVVFFLILYASALNGYLIGQHTHHTHLGSNNEELS